MGIKASCLHLVCANTWLRFAPLSHPYHHHLLFLYLSLSLFHLCLCLFCYQGFSHMQLTKLRSLVHQLPRVISCKLMALGRPRAPDTCFRPHTVFLVQNLMQLYLQNQKMASNSCTLPQPPCHIPGKPTRMTPGSAARPSQSRF